MSWGSLESRGLSSILINDHQPFPPHILRPSRPRSPTSALPESAAKNKTVLYMFFTQLTGLVSHSLYAVEIPSAPFPPLLLPISKESLLPSDTKIANQIFPILLFYSNREFPNAMRCVELDSKLYFLGGEMEIQPTTTTRTRTRTLIEEEEEEEDLNIDHFYPIDTVSDSDSDSDYNPPKQAAKLFPSNVYILDCATATSLKDADASKLLTPATPMKTGKSEPLVFVASGKIYALSGPPKGDIPLFEYLQYFEMFDPKTNKWTPLPPPPSPYYRYSSISTHSIVNNKLYVLLYPLKSSRLYCFDLDSNEWIPPYKLKCQNPFLDRISNLANFVGNTLYGLLGSTLVAFGPVKDTDEDGEFFNPMVRFSDENYSVHPLLVFPVSHVIHLGDRRLCHVVTGYPPEGPLLKNGWRVYTMINTETIYFSFTIFDALTTSEDGCTYPVTKPLHYAHFFAHTPWNGCHPILRNLLLT